MITPITLGFVMPEEYTPLSTHDAAIASVDDRVASVEASLASLEPARVSELEKKVVALETELGRVKQSAAAAADLEAATVRITAAEEAMSLLGDQLSSFSFRTGTVADLQAMGSLADDQLFVVVDTQENLQSMAEQSSTAETYMSFAFGTAATPR